LPAEDLPVEAEDPDGIIALTAVQPEEEQRRKRKAAPGRQRLGEPEPPPNLAPIGGGDPPGGSLPPLGDWPACGSGGPPPLPPAPQGADPDGIVAGAQLAEEPQRKRQKVGGEFIPGLDGAMVKFQMYIEPVTKKTYPNYTLKCPCAGHASCFKTKGESADSTARHGRIGPLGLLHAWIPVRDPKGLKSHPATNPTQADIDAYVAERKA